MSLTVSDILRKIEVGGEIPTLAPIMRRLLALKGDNSDSKLLLELVQNDAAIASRLLRATNAPGQYGDPDSNVAKAVDRLGLQNVRHLALATTFRDDEMEDAEPEEQLRMQWIWQRSLCTAVAAETLAERAGLSEVHHYRSLGLLLDIGILFLLNNFPDEYSPLLDRWRTEGGYLTEIEIDQLGVDHTIVGQQLAKAWSLGPELEMAIRHHSVREPDASSEMNLQVLVLANLSSAVLFEDRHKSGLERAMSFAAARFDIERQEFLDILQRISLVADGAAVRIAIEAGPAVPYVDLLRSINVELGRATLSAEQMVRELEIAMQKANTLAIKLEEANRKLRHVANIDPLTHIYNRRFFEEFLEWNFNRAKRYDTTLGCLMVDIDHFKKVNDTYGHLTGDRVLEGIAETLRENLRNTDIIARYGGEEFIVLLPDTRADAVAVTAAKLKEAAKKKSFAAAKKPLHITISIGYIAYIPSRMPEIVSPEDLIRTADLNMYQAKIHGRDRIWPLMESESLIGS
jgi:two-component system, cell cycle response regulator